MVIQASFSAFNAFLLHFLFATLSYSSGQLAHNEILLLQNCCLKKGSDCQLQSTNRRKMTDDFQVLNSLKYITVSKQSNEIPTMILKAKQSFFLHFLFLFDRVHPRGKVLEHPPEQHWRVQFHDDVSTNSGSISKDIIKNKPKNWSK